jgi:hypothetical protein
LTADLKKDRVPKDFSKLLLEKYREYGESEAHKEAFRYFATRILPAVNAGLTRYDKRRCKEPLSSCFSYTDEAFGLLLVINYEDRWRSQHEAERLLPGGTSKERSQRWEDAKYTSATEGARRGSSWPREGLLKFNELSGMVKRQREEVMETEEDVEENLMNWCRTGDGLDAVDPAGGHQIATYQIAAEEDEVEAWGECDITEV